MATLALPVSDHDAVRNELNSQQHPASGVAWLLYLPVCTCAPTFCCDTRLALSPGGSEAQQHTQSILLFSCCVGFEASCKYFSSRQCCGHSWQAASMSCLCHTVSSDWMKKSVTQHTAVLLMLITVATLNKQDSLLWATCLVKQ